MSKETKSVTIRQMLSTVSDCVGGWRKVVTDVRKCDSVTLSATGRARCVYRGRGRDRSAPVVVVAVCVPG